MSQSSFSDRENEHSLMLQYDGQLCMKCVHLNSAKN